MSGVVNGTKRSDLSCETNVSRAGFKKNIYFEFKSDEVMNNKKIKLSTNSEFLSGLNV